MTELMKRYEAETGRKATFFQMVIDSEGNETHNELTTLDFDLWATNQAENLEKENAQLKDQLRWRPVSEKPKEGQIIFAVIHTGWVVAQYLHDEFYVDDGFTFGDRIGGVTSWLPIPSAPEGE